VLSSLLPQLVLACVRPTLHVAEGRKWHSLLRATLLQIRQLQPTYNLHDLTAIAPRRSATKPLPTHLFAAVMADHQVTAFVGYWQAHHQRAKLEARSRGVLLQTCRLHQKNVSLYRVHYDNDTFRSWFAYASHDLRKTSQALRSQMRNAVPAAVRVLTSQ
jgi:hypothetical protein